MKASELAKHEVKQLRSQLTKEEANNDFTGYTSAATTLIDVQLAQLSAQAAILEKLEQLVELQKCPDKKEGPQARPLYQTMDFMRAGHTDSNGNVYTNKCLEDIAKKFRPMHVSENFMPGTDLGTIDSVRVHYDGGNNAVLTAWMKARASGHKLIEDGAELAAGGEVGSNVQGGKASPIKELRLHSAALTMNKAK